MRRSYTHRESINCSLAISYIYKLCSACFHVLFPLSLFPSHLALLSLPPHYRYFSFHFHIYVIFFLGSLILYVQMLFMNLELSIGGLFFDTQLKAMIVHALESIICYFSTENSRDPSPLWDPWLTAVKSSTEQANINNCSCCEIMVAVSLQKKQEFKVSKAFKIVQRGGNWAHKVCGIFVTQTRKLTIGPINHDYLMM